MLKVLGFSFCKSKTHVEENIAQKRKITAFSPNFPLIFMYLNMSEIEVVLKIQEPPNPRLEARAFHLSNEKC